MRTLLALALVGFLALMPAAARAQSAADAMVLDVQQAPVEGGPFFGLTPEHALTVGVGMVAGVLLLDIFVGSAPAALVGAAAGALIGNWWYYAQPEKGMATRSLSPAYVQAALTE